MGDITRRAVRCAVLLLSLDFLFLHAHAQLTNDSVQVLNRRATASYQEHTAESIIAAIHLWHRLYDDYSKIPNGDFHLVQRRAGALNNIGRGYRELNRPDSALYYFRQALELCDSPQAPFNQAMLLYNIADIFERTHQRDTALAYFQRALVPAQAIRDEQLIAYIRARIIPLQSQH